MIKPKLVNPLPSTGMVGHNYNIFIDSEIFIEKTPNYIGSKN